MTSLASAANISMFTVCCLFFFAVIGAVFCIVMMREFIYAYQELRRKRRAARRDARFKMFRPAHARSSRAEPQ